MKFSVEREVLGAAVSWVARALPTRPVLPVLAAMRVQAAGDRLTLSCFDYETSAQVHVEAEVGEPGVELVPGRLLAEIVKSLPSAVAEVHASAEMLMLTCGNAEFSLVTLPVADYPSLPERPAVVGTVDGGALAAAVAQVAPSASRDDTLAALTGVCLDIDGRSITMAATDRYRLAARVLAFDPVDPGARARLLVPARTLADMARAMMPGTPVTLAFGPTTTEQARPGDGMITFEGAGRSFSARLIGGEFVRYESRFPAGFECRAELLPGPFIEAVRRVALVADPASPVRLAFTRDAVVVDAQSAGRARAVETLSARFSGPDQAISFNPQYLLDGLAAAAVCGSDGGRVRLEFTTPARPAVITWADAGDPAGLSGNEAVPAQPEPAGDGDIGDGRHGPGAAPFRYLVVPLRAPAVG